MNDWHLEDAFAPVPAVVRNHIDDALTEVHEMNRKHRKPALALALAVALILALAGGAVAAGVQWNMFDFFARKYNAGEALPQAVDLVKTDVPQSGGVTPDATFTVVETLCDGRNAYLLCEVRPTREDTLLVYSQHLASSAASGFDPELPDDMTMAEWAEANGYTRVVNISMTHDNKIKDGFTWDMTDAQRQPDGSYRFLLQGRYTWSTASDVTMTCGTTTRWKQDGTPTEYERAELTATLEPGPEALWHVEWKGEALIPDTDIVVQKVVLTGTALGTYSQVTFRNTGGPTYSWSIYLVDENGHGLKWNAGVGSVIGMSSAIDDNRCTFTASYEPMPEPPKVLRISSQKDPGVGVRTVVINLEE